MDPSLRDGYVRSLHDMATRAEEEGHYRPEEDPYYGHHPIHHDPYGQHLAAGPSGTSYHHQQSSDLDLGANTIYGHLPPLMGDHQGMQPMRDMYHTGLDLGAAAWDSGYSNGNVSLNQMGELPMSDGQQQDYSGDARPVDASHANGDQHGIEHAAALLSMAYQMHKERKPSQEEISPTSGSSSSHNSGFNQNSAIDPGLQTGWPPAHQPEHHYVRSHNVLAAGTLFDEDSINQGQAGGGSFDASMYLPSNQVMRTQDTDRNVDPGLMSILNGGVWSAPQPMGSGTMTYAGIESWAGVSTFKHLCRNTAPPLILR